MTKETPIEERPANRRGKARQDTDNPEAIALFGNLVGLSQRESEIRAELDSILEVRNATFLRLVQLDVTYREIAEHTNVTPMGVRKAVERMTGRP